MKWFKHDCDALVDVRLELVISKFGMEGYGIYFATLEIIGSNIEEDKPREEWGILPELFDVDYMAMKLKMAPDRLQKIYDHMAKLGLIEAESWSSGRIACRKILKRLDTYIARTSKKSKTNFEESSKSFETKFTPTLHQEEIRLEEKRREEEDPLPTLSFKKSLKNHLDDLDEDPQRKKALDSLVEAFHYHWPEHRKKYSTAGAVKCRQEFTQRLADGWTFEEIQLRMTTYADENDDTPAPWDIFKDNAQSYDRPPELPLMGAGL